MDYHWNWGIFLEQVKAGEETYLHWLATGLGWTLAVSVAAWLLALAIGIAIGTLRTVPHKGLVALGAAWVELFRNIPLLVQMFLWYFVMPEILPTEMGDWLKQTYPNLIQLPFAQFSLWEFTAAVLCLGLYTASRVAEQVRAGFLTEQEARESRFRHIITRSVGFERDVQVDGSVTPVRVGDCLLLCSDGLSNFVEEPDLIEVLSRQLYRDVPQVLVDLANARGGDDNITVVLIHIANDLGPEGRLTLPAS